MERGTKYPFLHIRCLPWSPCARLFSGTGILPVHEEMTGKMPVPPIQPVRPR